MVYADANVFLRFILNDNEEMADYAEKLLENEEVYLLHEVISEMVYVLSKVYQTKREEITKQLSMLLKYTTTTDQKVMEYALQIYEESTLDFVDCILCAYHRTGNVTVVTFDKKLKNRLSK